MKKRTLLVALLAAGLIALPASRGALAHVGSWAAAAVQLSQDGGQAGGTQTGGTQTGGTQTGGTQAGGTQAGGTQAPPATPPAADPPKAEPVKPEQAPGKATTNDEKPSLRFGEDIFEPARRSIRAARERASAAPQAGNAFEAPTGPIILGSVSATPPETYQLGPGDKITLRVSSQFTDPTETKLTVDNVGAITLPQSGNRVVVRGRTLSEAEEFIRKEVSGFVRNAVVSLELNELRTFTVTLLGESFAPGAYQVPSTFSLFNLILATGGPTERGSLRSVQLRRNNAPSRTFDLYKFLIAGEAGQDTQLQPGDVVFFPVSKGQISVEGEVNRPGVYEVAGEENLQAILEFAGGIRPSAVAQNVAIDSILPGAERRLLNVDVKKRTPAGNPSVFDGDKIRVFSIRAVLRNVVSVSGAVEQPRDYALAPGMTISRLIEQAFGLKPEAYLKTADLKRQKPDGSFALIRVNLEAALKKDPKADIKLEPNDSLRVYDVNETAWMGERKVSLQGAVRNPGEFYRADNMTVGDLVRQGRGLEPDAFPQEAHLQRFNQDGTPGPLVKVNLMKAAMGDPEHDVMLRDRDRLRVYRNNEWEAAPEKSVTVSGAVQRPGTVPLYEGLTVKALIELSGGFNLDAHREDAFVQRVNSDGTLGPTILINPTRALEGSSKDNLVLQARDTLRIYNKREWRASPDQTVEVLGAVQRPGISGLGQGMTVRDLVLQAGGPTLDAFLEKAFLQSINTDGTVGIIRTINIDKALAGDPEHNLALASRDRLNIQTKAQANFRDDQTVTIRGGVQRPGAYPAAANMTLQELISLAGGLLPNASGQVEISSTWRPLGEGLQNIAFAGEVGAWTIPSLPVRAGDVVSVFQRSDIKERPQVVTILGFVKNPGAYAISRPNERISDIIKRAGGFAPGAFPKGAEFIRDPRFLSLGVQRDLAPRVSAVLKQVADEEYKRAQAMLDLDRLRIVFSRGASIGGGGSSAVPVREIISGGGGASNEGFQPGDSLDKALATALTSQGVTQARLLTERDFFPSGNLNARLDRAVARPGGRDDITVKDGDVIMVPLTPTTVIVSGAVAAPAALLYEDGKSLGYYVNRAGGLTRDADQQFILIIRATGELVRYRRGTRVELGDTILVPTKVQAIRWKDETPVLQSTVQSFTSAATTIALLRALTR